MLHRAVRQLKGVGYLPQDCSIWNIPFFSLSQIHLFSATHKVVVYSTALIISGVLPLIHTNSSALMLKLSASDFLYSPEVMSPSKSIKLFNFVSKSPGSVFRMLIFLSLSVELIAPFKKVVCIVVINEMARADKSSMAVIVVELKGDSRF